MKADNTSPLSLHPLILAVALLSLCLHSCTPVREAQQIVATSDSLRTAGVQYTDSTAMADAATTLEHVHLLYPTAYAHANYYYGRILREHNDHPAAMLAFLRVVHSQTHDHAIKGRSYSNIANMCRLAAEHELAYDIYERSAEEFLRVPDSTAYYYALNNMAFELAEDKRSCDAISLTNIIESECSDENVLTKIWESRADAYIQAQAYDSAIYCAHQLQSRGNHEPTGYLFLAQAYDNLGISDSALHYARLVMEQSSYHGDKYNVLYILSHHDSTLSSDEILTLTSDREDLRFDEYEPEKVMLTQAVQLLQQELNRKPDIRWLLAVLLTLAIIATALAWYVKRKRRKHQLISQQIEEAQAEHQKRVAAEIEIFCQSITDASSLKTTLCWNDFDKMCAIVNNRMFGLADKLKALGVLNEREIRLCILVVIGKFRDKEMADILFYGENSFRAMKSMVAKKLGTTGKNLLDFLLKMAILL